MPQERKGEMKAVGTTKYANQIHESCGKTSNIQCSGGTGCSMLDVGRSMFNVSIKNLPGRRPAFQSSEKM
jgi:hypothetical protein